MEIVSICLMVLAFVCFVVSSLYEKVINEFDIYAKNINITHRPWGLKLKELRELKMKSDNKEVVYKVGMAIILRKAGFICLVLIVILLFVINPLINSQFLRAI